MKRDLTTLSAGGKIVLGIGTILLLFTIGLIVIGIMCALTGCTMVSYNRVFPKPAWYWSKEAVAQRKSKEIPNPKSQIPSKSQTEKSQSSETGLVTSVGGISLMPVEVTASLRSATPGAAKERTNELVGFDQEYVRLKSFPDDRWEVWHSTNFAQWEPLTNFALTVKTVRVANLPQEYFRTRITNTFTGWTSGWATVKP